MVGGQKMNVRDAAIHVLQEAGESRKNLGDVEGRTKCK